MVLDESGDTVYSTFHLLFHYRESECWFWSISSRGEPRAQLESGLSAVLSPSNLCLFP